MNAKLIDAALQILYVLNVKIDNVKCVNEEQFLFNMNRNCDLRFCVFFILFYPSDKCAKNVFSHFLNYGAW